ncbi:MAG TPA: sigma 54-interacting transcriptional regulator [Ignavibacteriaceae bacterium]|nr:sigma 54-interacting transcriptional regulator [Ignavibacteriaceae bacterium]HQI41971.1 sigma 54-interacting transcriptional regulator [Ignavibacteriaceae bacterium]
MNIKIYSDNEDISAINSALRQVELESVPIAFTNPKAFAAEDDTIIILQIDSLASGLLNEVFPIKRDVKNKIIVVIRNNNALLVSTIAKMGLRDIFIFPYEILKFTSYIKEIVSDGLYKTTDEETENSNWDKFNLTNIVGSSEKFARTIELAKKVSEQSTSNILILGETGTGKGLFARAIHNHGKNRKQPFVDIVCTAIPESLLESELFGYEAGAFTNARTRKLGLFEIAGDGTLFLDEIGDMSLALQAKLLRAIEKKVIKRLGGLNDIPINSRIISATNKKISQMVSEGLFRRDLFHRLNVVTIELPPLRERNEDIITLADFFISEFNRSFNKSVKKISKELKYFFLGYPWPGNVRELKNVIERAVLLSDDGDLRLSDFSNLSNTVPAAAINLALDKELPENVIRMDLNFGTTNLKKLTKFYAHQVLEKTGGNKSQTAKLLGISRPKLDSLISKKK